MMKFNLKNLVLLVLVALIYGVVCCYFGVPIWFVAISSVIIGFSMPNVVVFK